ncbi:hypothetical protein BU14_0085s0035 [Porphyra umbilicalis]|uniref:Uncharacterized protein n=1 Tax=Porphyra umbilicalis TaxID=2786 RepID=A0A1X6PEA6_PORUM|nr:hypothetical protein BU14_0085s0035 [Porphyra umbilicalis]|eukprot:OSX79184.1 hypothetical protein BU14_0085s0035 [Porphyra umbilicalis]
MVPTDAAAAAAAALPVVATRAPGGAALATGVGVGARSRRGRRRGAAVADGAWPPAAGAVGRPGPLCADGGRGGTHVGPAGDAGRAAATRPGGPRDDAGGGRARCAPPASDVERAARVPREAPSPPPRAPAGGGAGADEPTLGGVAVGAGHGVAAGAVAAGSGSPPASATCRAHDLGARRVAAAAAVTPRPPAGADTARPAGRRPLPMPPPPPPPPPAVPPTPRPADPDVPPTGRGCRPAARAGLAAPPAPLPRFAPGRYTAASAAAAPFTAGPVSGAPAVGAVPAAARPPRLPPSRPAALPPRAGLWGPQAAWATPCVFAPALLRSLSPAAADAAAPPTLPDDGGAAGAAPPPHSAPAATHSLALCLPSAAGDGGGSWAAILAAPRPPTQRDLARGVYRAALVRITPPTVARAPGRTRRHSRILYLVRDALAASPEWTDVVLEQAVEADVDAGARGVRFDVRAARVGSGALAWGDMSVAATLSSKFLERVAADPGVAEAAVRREAQKVAKYGHRELHLSLFLILWHAPRLFVALCTLFLFFSYSRSLKTPALQRSQKCSKSASAGS